MENKNEIVLFKHEKFGEIGVIFENGNPLFPATECAKILGYEKPNNAISRHCRYSLKRGVPHPQSANKTIEKIFIPEGDLYRLIMRSKLPEAVEFESWVCDIILPSLRKHGAYFTPQALYESLCDPKNLIEILQALADEQKRNTDLSIENAYLSVKARYYDEILNSTNNVPVTQIAKDYGMSAIGFNKMLHEYGIQYPIRNSWVLYAEYANLGYTQSKTYKYAENKAAMHTCWTQKGRLFLYEFLRERGVLPMCEKECCNEAFV
ncbi:MAG: phage antirepressor KilAC domain-containing protein [Ruminiclostridium sp.]|nr:phage antirepressor KilAC domain-containing protein [Ruminiclostridium sp.]